jgi:hypothetical protein
MSAELIGSALAAYSKSLAFSKCLCSFDGIDGVNDVSVSVPGYITELLATKEGLELVKAFSRIKNRNLRRAIVDLVEQIEPE